MKLVEPQPKRNALTVSDLYLHNKHINLPLLSKELAHQTLLEPLLFKELIRTCMTITNNEPNLIQVTDPVTIIGDIHGQFYDMLKILSYTDFLKGQGDPQHKAIFLGDYVDRGINSVEVTILLIALKINFPNNVILLRGNHESRIMTEQYNFRQQCIEKYSQDIYDLLMGLFDSLPLVCVVNKAFFCVHGGISDKMVKMSRINTLNRKTQIPLDNNLFCDLIWSDPVDQNRNNPKIRSVYNYSRDCSIIYGSTLTNDFLNQNGLTTIIRAHEVFLQGYKMHMWNKHSDIPPVITVFSAPNYCGNCGNKGAILKITNGQIKIKQIKQQEPQKHIFLSKFDVFSWTLPQILRNVHEFMTELTNIYVNTRIPEMRKLPLQIKGELLVRYAYHSKKIEPIIPQPKIVRVSMNSEEQRNFLFNRSIDYYAEKQKAPKHK